MTDPSGNLAVLVIEGTSFSDFDGFTREFSGLLEDHTWRGNLDAFNDILRGGFGTPESGWVLRWLNSESSRIALGYGATIRLLEGLLLTCHPSNRPHVEARIRRARCAEGSTLFDEIVEIIRNHGPRKPATRISRTRSPSQSMLMSPCTWPTCRSLNSN